MAGVKIPTFGLPIVAIQKPHFWVENSLRKRIASYSKGEIITGAYCNASISNSAHWTLTAQSEIGEIASLIYAYEASHLSTSKLKKFHPEARFQVKPLS
jgi:hypothetical protein